MKDVTGVCKICGCVGVADEYHSPYHCIAYLQKQFAQCQMERTALLAACEMGCADVWHGGNILRAAANILIDDYPEETGYIAKLIAELRAKATAEQSAIKAAQKEEA